MQLPFFIVMCFGGPRSYDLRICAYITYAAPPNVCDICTHLLHVQFNQYLHTMKDSIAVLLYPAFSIR